MQDATRAVQNMIAQNQLRKYEISAMWAQGVFEKEAEKVQYECYAIKCWNESNPVEPIHINFANILQRVRAMREDREHGWQRLHLRKYAPQCDAG